MTPRPRAFCQVDVFGAEPFAGNPVAVVLDGAGLPEEQMARFAAWTNLSETTFLLPPQHPDADYRLRIFTPGGEIPFAGHPTLGSAHAWLAAGGRPRRPDRPVQECGIGLVEMLAGPDGLSFRAPPPIRTGPLDEPLLDRIAAGLRLDRRRIVDHQWVDNGPGWAAVRVASAAEVLELEPDHGLLRNLMVGVVGAHPDGSPEAFEVRAFADAAGIVEDPVTGSLNAGLAQWLIAVGAAPAGYRASQGSRVGRRGIVNIRQERDQVWVGGACVTGITGSVEL